MRTRRASAARALGLAALAACGGGDEPLLVGNSAARAHTAARDDARAVAAYEALELLLPGDTSATAGLFHAHARTAEHDGRVAPGAADQWLRELASVLDDPPALESLIRRVRRAGCEACAVSLERLAARRAARAAR